MPPVAHTSTLCTGTFISCGPQPTHGRIACPMSIGTNPLTGIARRLGLVMGLVDTDADRSNTLQTHWRAQPRQVRVHRHAVDCRRTACISVRSPADKSTSTCTFRRPAFSTLNLKAVIADDERRGAIVHDIAEFDPSGMRSAPPARRNVERNAVIARLRQWELCTTVDAHEIARHHFEVREFAHLVESPRATLRRWRWPLSDVVRREF